MNKICIVYTHHKLGDLIWQLPYIKAISQHHQTNIDLVVREKTQAQNICLLYTSPSPRDKRQSRMPSSA